MGTIKGASSRHIAQRCAFLAANEAFNRGDAGPIRDLIANDYAGPDGMDHDAFAAAFDASLGGKFEQFSVVTQGPFLVGTGRGELADGSVVLMGRVAQFNNDGKLQCFTQLVASHA